MNGASDRRPLRGRHQLFLVAGGLSLFAVALGGWICVASGVPMALWARNAAAWLVGAAAAWGLSRASGPWLFRAALVAAALLLAATLASRGQLGVHRWIGLGPLAVNAAMLALPAAAVALAATRSWGWLLALGCLAILVAQPDASQATAFAAALLWIAWRGASDARVRAAAAASAILLAAAAWLRPDPLQPVPEVEGVLRLAYAVSPALAALALGALLLFSLAPAVRLGRAAPETQVAAGALSLYFLASAAMPFVGAFPAPLLGLGVSPILGAWLGLGLLAALAQRKPTRSVANPRKA